MQGILLDEASGIKKDASLVVVSRTPKQLQQPVSSWNKKVCTVVQYLKPINSLYRPSVIHIYDIRQTVSKFISVLNYRAAGLHTKFVVTLFCITSIIASHMLLTNGEIHVNFVF